MIFSYQGLGEGCKPAHSITGVGESDRKNKDENVCGQGLSPMQLHLRKTDMSLDLSINASILTVELSEISTKIPISRSGSRGCL